MESDELIMPRLDPDSIFPYVCNDDRNNPEPTIFYLKGLNVLEFRKCEEFSSSSQSKIGRFNLEVLKYGLVKWDKFYWSDTNDLIPFDYKNLSAIPYLTQSELVNEILKISDLNEKLENDLIFVSRWSNYLRNVENQEQWNCEFCIANNQAEIRNCDGTKPNKCITCNIETEEEKCPKCGRKTSPHFKMRIGKPPLATNVTRCPIALLSPIAVKLTNLINYMENSKSLPFKGGALEQTNFFYNVRMVVMSEQNALLKSELDNKSKG